MDPPLGTKIAQNLKKDTSRSLLENTSQKVIENEATLTPSRPGHLGFSLEKTLVRTLPESPKKDLRMTPKASIWEAFGHQNLEKYPQEGLQKNTHKKNAKKLPNCLEMTPKRVDVFEPVAFFFHAWPPWGAHLAPDASQRASQRAFQGIFC